MILIQKVNITTSPDYALAQKTASSILKLYASPILPINLHQTISNIPNLNVRTYTQISETCNCSVDEVCEIVDSNDGVLWYRKSSDDYALVYNDTITNEGQKRFTIAHELGHYFLRHDEQNGISCTSIDRLKLFDSEEYKTDEKEANYFAKRLLAPIPLINDLTTILKSVDVFTLANVFDVSLTVAQYIIDNMNNLQKCGFYPADTELSALFQPAVAEAATPYLVSSAQ